MEKDKLKRFYDEEQRLIQYPSKRPLRILALSAIAEKFDASRKYSEKEVNEVIRSSIAFSDVELIRRELFQYKFMGRLKDGSEYWVEDGWRDFWLSDKLADAQQVIELKLYAEPSEKICLTFNPLKMNTKPDWNPAWEEWHCCREPLRIYLADYERLLKKYFDMAYPTKDAFDGTEEKVFDLCFDNWFGRTDWQIIISGIEADLDMQPEDIKKFYCVFLKWIKNVLENTEIIVVEGNL